MRRTNLVCPCLLILHNNGIPNFCPINSHKCSTKRIWNCHLVHFSGPCKILIPFSFLLASGSSLFFIVHTYYCVDTTLSCRHWRTVPLIHDDGKWMMIMVHFSLVFLLLLWRRREDDYQLQTCNLHSSSKSSSQIMSDDLISCKSQSFIQATSNMNLANESSHLGMIWMEKMKITRNMPSTFVFTHAN